MTRNRDFKRLIRARAAKTGESYQTARQQLLGQATPSVLSPEETQIVEAYFPAWWEALREFQLTRRPFREFKGVPVPVAAMQAGALRHPNPRIRRSCLGVLDHEANDESMDVFRLALRDGVPRVRLAAIHGLSCARCKTLGVSQSDIADDLLRLVQKDDSAKVRHAALLAVEGFLDDSGVRRVVVEVNQHDTDPLVQELTSSMLRGERSLRKSRKALRRRRRPERSGRRSGQLVADSATRRNTRKLPHAPSSTNSPERNASQ
jgi:hypothetical protein